MKTYTFILIDKEGNEYFRKDREFNTLIQARSYAFQIWVEAEDCYKIEVEYLK